MTLRRYHHKIYFPKRLKNMLGEFVQQFRQNFQSKNPECTNHALEQLYEDQKAKKFDTIIPLPTFDEIFNSSNELVEFYENLDRNNQPTGTIQKAVIRVYNLHESLDFTYVVAREGFIVSAWANDKGDDHRLNFSENKYYKPRRRK